ncbi:class I SAM-dependent methyltransferase [Govanella unica]|uniref:Class I SAM-dependent methyltransferase n=1 Tax=Govanella unica TaxID=2975056 RepID=A0A9X3TVS8_9PROT|nr:class I SAM-dependent methyltransferase [Govania unica]MDA5192920.1 class I SAM-dependent methyltransferase [Govania unica]
MTQPTESRRGVHAVMPLQTAAEETRFEFSKALKTALRTDLKPKLRERYDSRARAAFEQRHNRAPETGADVEEVMGEDALYRWWSALLRAQQENYVQNTLMCVDRQLDDLTEKCQSFTASPKLGSLRLDPSLPIPYYQADVDIHCVPGSYFFERHAGDVGQGARSDLGAFVFSLGRHGPYNEDKGICGINFLHANFPDLKPTRILDLGCTVGQSTLPYATAFPGAELHAIDLAAPCLRYGHARAEALGKAVHFSQQNAEQTDFADESFDVIVSHIMLHETSGTALQNILRECRRLLKPGGVMLHIEVPIRPTDPFDRFLAQWDCRHNNEPFWGTLATLDLKALAVKAGFAADRVFETAGETAFAKTGGWLVYGATKEGASA